ncbi:MAG: 5'/3'-nucleotidase SurE [Alphaproteobacteria bacterium]|nr:5'/3'-nucleotidase SurE [Alphaproteobacteria bacterium]
MPALPPITDLSRARILVTNDDGINAPGLRALERVARSLSRDVWTVAPETQQSAVSHALTIRRPLRLVRMGPRRFAVEGTPTDCVLIGVHEVMQGRAPDLVLSGVNWGANLGEDITYSGTVAAAMEGALLGLRAVAFSLDIRNGVPRWETVVRHAPIILGRLVGAPWPAETLVNVNVPNLAPDKVQGIRVVAQGRRKEALAIDRRTDPDGRPYYWMLDYGKEARQPEGTDLGAIAEGAITITPLTIDFTQRRFLATLRERFR